VNAVSQNPEVSGLDIMLDEDDCDEMYMEEEK
jgi:hypothetical protein